MYILYMSSDVSVTQARDEIGPLTNQVEYGGETVYLTKHGRRSAALVHPHAAELLEDLEELIDIEVARTALLALESGEDSAVPFRRRTRERDR